MNEVTKPTNFTDVITLHTTAFHQSNFYNLCCLPACIRLWAFSFLRLDSDWLLAALCFDGLINVCVDEYLQPFPYGHVPFWAQWWQKSFCWVVLAFVPKRSNTLGRGFDISLLFGVRFTVIFRFTCLDIFTNSSWVGEQKLRINTWGYHIYVSFLHDWRCRHMRWWGYRPMRTLGGSHRWR